MTKSAMITICGRPNVGKSTLINSLVGDKVAIVSSKPQTTRNRIIGIANLGETQFVLLDTPGYIKPRNKLGDFMVKTVRESLADVDCILFLVEPQVDVGPGEKTLADQLKKSGVPIILIINKIDIVKDKEMLLPIIASYSTIIDFDAVVPISALTKEGIDSLLKEMDRFSSIGPHLFPDDMITDQPERQICSELIREQILTCLEREVPHGIAVEISKFYERNDRLIEIEAIIYCEKKSHKGILIGKNGFMLKKIGQSAREEIEKLLGTKVFLQTWVKVKENWRNSEISLRNFGFRDEQ